MLGISHLSLTINSSINFLIYFSLGKRFKAATNRFTLQPIPSRLRKKGPNVRKAAFELQIIRISCWKLIQKNRKIANGRYEL